MLKYSTFEKKKQHFYKISLPVHVLLILKTESFEGTLMSDSITMEKEYQQAMEKINELLKEQETKQKSEEEKIAEKYAEMNQTPWPEEALAGIPKACDLVYEFYDWKDEDGYFWFVGRTDDVIKSSGYRIGPFEVESALMEHPAVLECAVTAVPDEVRGQVVKATIVLARGYAPSEELKVELQEHVKRVTAPYKYPRIVEFVDELPKTISGKIRRVEIRDKDKQG